MPVCMPVPVPNSCRWVQKTFGEICVGECFFWNGRIMRKDAEGRPYSLLMFDEITISPETLVEAFENPPSS